MSVSGVPQHGSAQFGSVPFRFVLFVNILENKLQLIWLLEQTIVCLVVCYNDEPSRAALRLLAETRRGKKQTNRLIASSHCRRLRLGSGCSQCSVCVYECLKAGTFCRLNYISWAEKSRSLYF